MLEGIKFSLVGTGFTFFMTILGSAMVFIFPKNIKFNLQNVFLGFASGVMIAASIWSLLIPSIQISEEQGYVKWLPAAIGFAFGWIFLLIIDYFISDIEKSTFKIEKDKLSPNTTMMVIAVTFHNIPEGLAVGVSCAIAMQQGEINGILSSIILAIGMGLQNFPEGAAVSLPLYHNGMSKRKSFIMGCISGVVEPIAGIFGALLVSFVSAVMPFMLSFAAGAMIYVVVKELIPNTIIGKYSSISTIGVMVGFLIMMILDTALS